MKLTGKNMLRASVLLMLFALVGTGLLSLTHEVTREQIANNERQQLLRNIHKVIKPDMHDNDVYQDMLSVSDTSLDASGKAVTVYRARKQGKPIAAIFSSIAPNGYNGAIKLLIGVDMQGQLTGVRVIKHRETPGLGDSIEERRSDWILGFNGKSLENPAEDKWTVKKDGGAFDQFTGATITPRAVIKSIRNTLVYFRQHKQDVFK